MSFRDLEYYKGIAEGWHRIAIERAKQLRCYRRALEEIRDYNLDPPEDDFIGAANVMQGIAKKALEEE